MKRYQITVNPSPVSCKPTQSNQNIADHISKINLQTGMTITEFATLVTAPTSLTWFGGTFIRPLCNANWKSTQVIGIDFDTNEKSPNETLDILCNHGIHPQFLYSSFNSTEKHLKYRIVLFLDEPIENLEVRELVYKGLLALLPHADKSCANAARIFFGGIKGEIRNTSPIITQSLIDLCAISIISSDKGRGRYINPKLPIGPKTAENRDFLLDINRKSPISPTSKSASNLPTIEWTVAIERVRILREFVNGTWLTHPQLFGLATNLYQIKGGQQLMKETMTRYNNSRQTHYTENNFNILTYLKRVQYPALSIHSFSPYKEDAELYDLYTEVSDKRGKVDITNPIRRITLKEAELQLTSITKQLESPNASNAVTLIKIPTGLGKTELLTKIHGTLAFPTHLLKNEVGERMVIPYTTSPNALNFENNTLNTQLTKYYNTGLYHRATALIHDVASKTVDAEHSSTDIALAQDYILKLNLSTKSNQCVLTTHQRAINVDHQHHAIYFDEDPIANILPIGVARISDLLRLQLTANNLFGTIQSFVETLKSLSSDKPIKTPNVDFDIEPLIYAISETAIQTNLVGLLESQFLIKSARDQDTLHYIRVNPLKADKKNYILSATAPVELYKMIFGDTITVLEMPPIVQTGTIIQYTNKSCSRNSLHRYYDSIVEQVRDLPTITFKSFQHLFPNSIPHMYFGNCSGYNDQAGKDIAVVGTPHRNNIIYKLYAAVIGHTEFDAAVKYQTVEYGHFRFKFNTFNDPILQKIQLSLIESDLLQAVGRARSLRTSATVHLYSNFPINDANFKF